MATKLRFSSWSWTPALCVLDLYYKVVIFQLVLETCTSRTRLVLQSCDRVLCLCYKVAIFERSRLVLTKLRFWLELEAGTSRTRLVLPSRDFPAGAGNLNLAHQAGTTKLRFLSWSWKPVLRTLDLHYKVAIFKLELETCTSRARLALQSCDFAKTCTSRTTLVLQSCDFPASAGNLHFAHSTCTSKLRSSTMF